MEEFLHKKYVLVSSENLEDYFLHIGLGYLARKAALALKPTQWLTLNEDGTYTLVFSTALVSYKTIFTPGVEFVEEKPDGTKVQALIMLEGNKLIHTQRDANGVTSKHVREFYDDRMTTITTADGFNKIVTRQFVLAQ